MQDIKKENTRTNIFLMFTLIVMFMAGGHLLDIGEITNVDKESFLTNGYFNVNSDKTYHLGYYLMYVSFIVLAIIYTLKITKK